MTSKERIMSTFNRKEIDRNAFWIGMPHKDTNAIYFPHFGVDNKIDLSAKLGCDMYAIPIVGNAWKHPDGRYLFDLTPWGERHTLSQDGPFAECEDLSDVSKFPWPDPEYLDFSEAIRDAKRAREKGMAVFSGLWTMFFHDLCDLFGMENYFIKMHTDPEIVDAVTERVMHYYIEGNKMCFDAMGNLIDVFFFGNDLGSQLDLLMSPDCFRRFILPHIQKAVDLAKNRGYKVMMHSCGSINKIIPMLIDIGVDALHPIQAKACGMDADSLSKEYGRDLVFVGGVDTQELLPFGTPDDVRKEVKRLKTLFGSSLVISPSHEALLPNVSVENVLAMRDAAIHSLVC